MTSRKLHPDAARIVLRRLVKDTDMTQRSVAAAVGEREDSFSKILNGAEGYDLSMRLVVRVLNTLGVGFAEYGRQVQEQSDRM